MTPKQMLDALEEEKALLEDFICLSAEQVLLLKHENLTAFDALLQKRADLMMDLSILEVKLAQWIQSIHNDLNAAPAALKQMQHMNDEIVRMANYVIQIDEQAQRELDDIKQRTHAEIIDVNRRRFSRTRRSLEYPVRQSLELED